MGRFQSSIELFKQSWRVLKQDRELVWLPVISTVLSLILAALVLVPVALSQDWAELSNSQSGADLDLGTGTYVALAALSVGLAFVAVFFRGALVAGAHERLTGGDPTVRSAIAGALERLPKLFAWAIITTIVGTILRSIEQRSEWIGRIVINIIGMAWAVTTFLVIPAIIIENTGAVAATKRSVELFKRTWGDNLRGQVGLGLAGLVAFIPLILLGVLGAAIGSVIGFVLIAAAVIGGIVAAMVLSALGAIFQTALYHYAVGQAVPTSFEPSILRNSFAPK